MTIFQSIRANALYNRIDSVYSSPRCGGVAEWLKAPVLKTGEGRPFVSSNLTSSAIFINNLVGNPDKQKIGIGIF